MHIRATIVGLAVSIVLSACVTTGATTPVNPPSTSVAVAATTAPSSTTAPPVDTTSVPEPTPASPLADKIEELDSALYTPPGPAEPVPISISIDRLNIGAAPISQVGVLANGDMEVPAVSDVGWYRYGPIPGEEGSAVLASHIAYDGVPGIFRYLDRLEPGDVIEIEYSDGDLRVFAVTESTQYDKDEIPRDRIFAKQGPTEIALITCGGDFNRSLRSYEDNIIVYAKPAS